MCNVCLRYTTVTLTYGNVLGKEGEREEREEKM